MNPNKLPSLTKLTIKEAEIVSSLLADLIEVDATLKKIIDSTAIEIYVMDDKSRVSCALTRNDMFGVGGLQSFLIDKLKSEKEMLLHTLSGYNIFLKEEGENQ